MKGSIALVVRGAAASSAAGAIASANPAEDITLAGRIDGGGGLRGFANISALEGARVDGTSVVAGAIDDIVSLGGEVDFFARGGIGGNASVFAAGTNTVVAGARNDGQAGTFGAARILTAAAAKADATGAIFAYANTNGLTSGTLAGAATVSGDIIFGGHRQLASGAVNVGGSIQATDAIRARAAGSSAATTTISGAIAIGIAAAAKADAAGGISAATNAAGNVAGELDAAGGLSGDVIQVTPEGTSWFLVGQIDGAGDMLPTPALAVAGGIAATSPAATSISPTVVIREGALGRFAGTGAISGAALRLRPAASEIGAAASINGGISVIAAASGEVDVAASINGGATGAGSLRGEIDASASVRANATRTRPAAATASASGSISGSIAVRARAAGRVSGASAISTGSIPLIARAAGRLDPDTEFTTEFTDEFGNADRLFGAIVVNPRSLHQMSGMISGSAGFSGGIAGRAFSSGFSSGFS